jgi:hypothetical protein
LSLRLLKNYFPVQPAAQAINIYAPDNTDSIIARLSPRLAFFISLG